MELEFIEHYFSILEREIKKIQNTQKHKNSIVIPLFTTFVSFQNPFVNVEQDYVSLINIPTRNLMIITLLMVSVNIVQKLRITDRYQCV